jgi:three-Cys-motif partner protein
MKKEFFAKQTNLTTAKIKVFEEYITGYLPKLLLTYKTCYIADLFCGPGRNGEKMGSPLVLIHQINYILTSPAIKRINSPKIHILFNDQESEYIDNLKEELSKIDYNKNIIEIEIQNKSYEDLLPSLLSKLKRLHQPKFIFLDPYTYSNVRMNDLKQLMNDKHSEVLLFSPLFHSYRFTTSDFNEQHKTRKFIEEFTTKGMVDYESVNEYMYSIKDKITKQVNLSYVRPVLINGGGSKNVLFLLTHHIKGMLHMNKVAFKITDDGTNINVNNINQTSLFQSDSPSLFLDRYTEKLKSILKEGKTSNQQIVEFTIQEGFLPKHASTILVDLSKKNRIVVTDSAGNLIPNRKNWNIAEIITKTTYFIWN